MKEWEFGLQRVINFPPSRKQSERTFLLKTLAGCPESENKIVRLLNITMLEGNGNFSETDMFLIFSMLTGSSAGYTTLFHFLSNNWEVLKERYVYLFLIISCTYCIISVNFKYHSYVRLVLNSKCIFYLSGLFVVSFLLMIIY